MSGLLPANQMYALRHGITGKIWFPCRGWWLFTSVSGMQKCWETLKDADIVGSEFSEHKIIVVKLTESSRKDLHLSRNSDIIGLDK